MQTGDEGLACLYSLVKGLGSSVGRVSAPRSRGTGFDPGPCSGENKIECRRHERGRAREPPPLPHFRAVDTFAECSNPSSSLNFVNVKVSGKMNSKRLLQHGAKAHKLNRLESNVRRGIHLIVKYVHISIECRDIKQNH